MNTNKVLIIAGMHRSGTSLITQWLYKCGLNIGERVLGPLIGNEEGHFEDLDFVETHKEILKELNLVDDGLVVQRIQQIPYHSKQELEKIISTRNRINKQWGWKDPRTCLFLPVYRELIPGAKYFFIIRDYESSVSSLINRIYNRAEKKYLARSWFSAFLWKNGRSKLRKWRLYKRYAQSYLKVWIAYNEQILNAIMVLPEDDYILLDYNLLKKQDELIFSHLTNSWDFSLHYFNFSSVYKGDLMNKPGDIRPFVRNKNLLDKASEIEEALRNFSYGERNNNSALNVV